MPEALSASAFPADYSVAVVSVKEKLSCEIIIGWVTDDFPLCETVLCRGLAFFPPCETFVGWVMEEFPCRKLVRDGYEVHCLPAIWLETVTDAFLAVAIGLKMFTEEIAILTKQLVKLTEEIATLQSSS